MSLTVMLTADAVVDRVAELIALRYRKSAIKLKLSDELGEPVSPRVLETVLQLARERLQHGAATTLEEHFEHAIAFWDLMISSDDTNATEKMRAQEQKQFLLGLGAQFNNGINSGQISEHFEAVRKAINSQHGIPESDGEN